MCIVKQNRMHALPGSTILSLEVCLFSSVSVCPDEERYSQRSVSLLHNLATEAFLVSLRGDPQGKPEPREKLMSSRGVYLSV